MHENDFHGTILHLLRFDHTELTLKHLGRNFRLADVATSESSPGTVKLK
jgi:hypothetical protein